MLRQPGNLLNQLQLGLSGFHFTFVSVDAALSNISLGFQKMTTPGFMIEGVGDVIKSSIPIANQVKTYNKGRKLYAEYLKPIEEQNPQLRPYIEAIEKSNMATRQDRFYKNQEFGLSGFGKALKNENPIGALLRSPGALIELQSKPLMDNYVPNIKLGSFMNQADFILRESKMKGWDTVKTNGRLQEAADSIDNRMGQLKYDNLFWNKTVKDLGLVAVRSLGWNLGTIRELGGGILDSRKIITEGRLTPRLAYTITLPIVTGMIGGIVQYAMSGKKPDELKDYFFPQTGRVLPDGSPERLSFPSYMKDVFAYAHDPLATIGHKIHPLAAIMIDMFNNKDFYGVEIRNIDDPLVKQVSDEMKYILKSFEPFSVRNYRQFGQQDKGKLEKGLAFGGIMPAPKYITNTPAQNLTNEIIKEKIPVGSRTAASAKKSQLKYDLINKLRKGTVLTFDDIQTIKANFTDEKTREIVNESKLNPFVAKVQHLSFEELLRVIQKANKKEVKLLTPILEKKFMNVYEKATVEEKIRLTGLLEKFNPKYKKK